MPGFGGSQRGGHGFAVAHLADEDDVGILAKDGANGLGESGRVGPHLNLFHERKLIRLLKFDWVFDGDDVVLAGAVDGIDQGRHGGGLAAAGSAREEDQSLAPLGEGGERRRKMQRFERRNLAGKEAD